MKIAIIGATGRVGTHLTKEALNRGNYVTAISRHTDAILPAERLSVRTVDVQNFEALSKILAGHDAVVSAFNPVSDQPSLYEHFIKGSKDIQRAVKMANVKRFLFVGGAGSLFINGRQVVDSPEFPTEWLTGARAARDYLEIIKEEADLDWTFLSPALMVHFQGQRAGKYRVNTESPVFDQNGKSQISGQDLAGAILDELESNQFIKKRFTVGY